MSERRELAILVGVPFAIGLLVWFWQTITAVIALVALAVMAIRWAYPRTRP